MTTPRERNELAVRELFDEVINGQEYDGIRRHCSPDVVLHRPGGAVVVGHDGYETHYRSLHTAFPDFEATLTDVVADTDRIATRFRVTGTHEGKLLDIPPTGTEVQFSAQILFRLTDAMVTEEFHQSDRYGLRAHLLSESEN